MAQYYFYIDNKGQSQGPVLAGDIVKLISPETLVFTEGMQQWVPAKQVAELAQLLGSSPSQQPVEPVRQPVRPAVQVSEAPKKSKNAIIWACAVVIVFLVGVIVFLLCKGNSSSTSASATTTASETEVAEEVGASLDEEAETETDEVDATDDSDYSYTGVNSNNEGAENVAPAIEKLKKWVRMINEHNADAVSSLYRDGAYYFKQMCTRDVIRKKYGEFFGKTPEVHIRISNIQVDNYMPGVVELSFDKHVRNTASSQESTYQSYSRFSNIEEGSVIIEESDLLSDRNLERMYSKAPRVYVSSYSTPAEVFVGNSQKWIETSYHELTSDGGDPPAGSFASCLAEVAETHTIQVSGLIQKNYKGRSNTYFVRAKESSAGYGYWYRSLVYDANTDQLTLE